MREHMSSSPMNSRRPRSASAGGALLERLRWRNCCRRASDGGMGPHKVLAATERRCRPRSYESGRRNWRLRVEEGWRLKEKLTRGVQVAASGGRLEGEGETDSLSVLVHTKVLAPIRSQYTKLECGEQRHTLQRRGTNRSDRYGGSVRPLPFRLPPPRPADRSWAPPLELQARRNSSACPRRRRPRTSSSSAAPPSVSVWASHRAWRFVSPRRRHRLGFPLPPSTASLGSPPPKGRRRHGPPPRVAAALHRLPRVAATLRRLGRQPPRRLCDAIGISTVNVDDQVYFHKIPDEVLENLWKMCSYQWMIFR
ncbi:hypothetical protein PVAP13_3NG182774 [Panicum virgatum]|uniref:Uncharacterized protein n=1 Tax=Panicum virgatum TaxID=38727 RepID=A0A8T0U9F8_PANVG|nr:hypothetical protein PVAP13_3NG182774 [Panicum virgatum]KAG2617654.1 hypothetical protein PVAP13_3NG182774 [Panicum virgatum]